MVRPLLRLIGLAIVAPAAVVAVSCSSDPVVDEPELVGVATVRDLTEVPDADITAPEVSGTRTVRFAYPLLSCAGAPGLPTEVEATYTIDTVAVVVTPPPLDCGEAEDPAETVEGLEVFLVEPVGDRDITGRVQPP